MKLLGDKETETELNLPPSYSTENPTIRDIEGSMLNPEHEKEMETLRNDRKIRLFKTDLMVKQPKAIIIITVTATSTTTTTSTTTSITITTSQITIPCLNGGEILC